MTKEERAEMRKCCADGSRLLPEEALCVLEALERAEVRISNLVVAVGDCADWLGRAAQALEARRREELELLRQLAAAAEAMAVQYVVLLHRFHAQGQPIPEELERPRREYGEAWAAWRASEKRPSASQATCATEPGQKAKGNQG